MFAIDARRAKMLAAAAAIPLALMLTLFATLYAI